MRHKLNGDSAIGYGEIRVVSFFFSNSRNFIYKFHGLNEIFEAKALGEQVSLVDKGPAIKLWEELLCFFFSERRHIAFAWHTTFARKRQIIFRHVCIWLLKQGDQENVKE